MSMCIRVVNSQDGDWTVVLVDGEVEYSGHTVPTDFWIHFLNSFGFSIKQTTISNERMLKEDYYDDSV